MTNKPIPAPNNSGIQRPTADEFRAFREGLKLSRAKLAIALDHVTTESNLESIEYNRTTCSKALWKLCLQLKEGK